MSAWVLPDYIADVLPSEARRIEELRRGLLDNGYTELPITSAHAVAVSGLPPLHRNPFDRLLVAQALTEGITLLTADALVAQYPGPVRRV